MELEEAVKWLGDVLKGSWYDDTTREAIKIVLAELEKQQHKVKYLTIVKTRQEGVIDRLNKSKEIIATAEQLKEAE